MKVQKYDITEKIFESTESIIYRAKDSESGENVILKMAITENSYRRIRNGYEILKDLDIPGVPIVKNIFQNMDKFVLVFADNGGEALSGYIHKIKDYPLKKICSIFIQIAKVVEAIHKKQIIHKDIKPSNILYDEETETIGIIDFGISTLFDMKLSDQNPINGLEGTLEYISPEQTGRINRSIDQRSDLYSLGITFYQLLTGKLPFSTNDPVQLIHFHISKLPERIETISDSFNEIIFKLMAKNPENRYQSVHGLIYDLTQISLGNNNFNICTKDYSGRLQFKEKLYGRNKELAQLKSLLDDEANFTKKNVITVVEGESGQGKSFLIEEMVRYIFIKNGYLLKGKFDQIHNHIPYNGFSQILSAYLTTLFAETIDRQELIRQEILKELGDNAGLLVFLNEEFKSFLGNIPLPAVLEGNEALNRFDNTFLKLFKVIAKLTNPLVLVIDDLQWGDHLSINFLRKLLQERNIPGLMLILSYRNKEDHYSEQFISLKEKLESLSNVQRIKLSNLTQENIQELINDTFGKIKNFDELSHFLFDTTNGNPFFLKEILKELYFHRALYFSYDEECWKFDASALQSLTISDNIVDFFKLKIGSLSIKCVSFLKVASCQGLIFDVKPIGEYLSMQLNELQNYVIEAKKSGLIYPLTENFNGEMKFSFIHDRVLQATYFLNTEDEMEEIYFSLGNYYKKDSIDSKIYDICNYYNRATKFFKTPEKKKELLELNYKALLGSKSASAYQSGLKYARVAKALSDEIHDLSLEKRFAIEEEYGWFNYVLGNFEEGELVYKKLLTETNDLKTIARLNTVRIGQLASIARIFDAVNLGLEVLSQFGISIPDSEEERGKAFFAEYNKILDYLNSHEVTDLLSLPEMQDEKQIIIQQILSRLLIPTILSSQVTLLGLLTCKSIMLVIENGRIDMIAYAYALFGVTIIGINKDYKKGIDFGEIALKQSQEKNNKALMGGVFNTVGCITNHLKYPAINNEDLFFEGSKYCEESGNVFEIALSRGNILWNKFYRGENLKDILEYSNGYFEICEKYNLWEAMINIYFPTMGIVNYLTGNQTDGDLLQYQNRTEIEHVKIVEELGSKSPLAQFYGVLVTKSFLFGKYEEVLVTGEKLETNSAAPTVFHDICPNFYRCISYMLVIDTLQGEDFTFYSQKIKTIQAEFQIYSELNPENFLHMHLLILAIDSMKKNNYWEAMNYFDQSIVSALENGYIQNAAIAYELAGNFFNTTGKFKIAETYYTEAYRLFKLWGAEVKLRSLEKKFPWLEEATVATPTLTRTQGLSPTRAGLSIDYISTIKAASSILTEVKIDKLIEKIIKIILENSGANEAILLIKNNDDFVVHAFGRLNEAIEIQVCNTPLNSYSNIPVQIIHYVIHSKKELILNKAYTHPEYLNNSYISQKKVQSLLCQPLLHQGNVLGIIYLENNLIHGVFSQERTGTINFIATLAAISLENAILYESMDEKVKSRTKELNHANSRLMSTNSLLEKALADLKSTQDQLVLSEKMVVLGKLIAGIAHEINTPLGAIVASNQISIDLISNSLTELIENYSFYGDAEKKLWEILFGNAKNKVILSDTGVYRKIRKELQKYLTDKEKPFDMQTIEGLAELGFSTENIDLIQPYLNLEKFEPIVEDSLNIFTILNSGRIIRDSAEKASRVIKALKNYVHQDEQEKRVEMDVVEEIKLCLTLYQNKIKQGMEVITDFRATKCVGYKDQLNQVWINLINNALHAMNYKGRLEIKTYLEDNFFCASFADNGHGIPPEIQEKIFNPFFTTKDAGEGSGLGLDICKKIVTKHEGKISFQTSPKGTCFIVQIDRSLTPELP